VGLTSRRSVWSRVYAIATWTLIALFTLPNTEDLATLAMTHVGEGHAQGTTIITM
jgi:hypothetical protein